MADWKKVYESEKLHRVEIVKAVLEDNGMQPILLNRKDSAYQIGYYELLVPVDNVLKAIKIIEDDIQFKSI